MSAVDQLSPEQRFELLERLMKERGELEHRLEHRLFELERRAGSSWARARENLKLEAEEFERWREAVLPYSAKIDRHIRRHNLDGGKRPHYRGALKAWQEAGLGDSVDLDRLLAGEEDPS